VSGQLRHVLVTGASRGVGEAVSARLAESGWRVWNLSSTATAASDAAVTHVRCDLRDPADVEAGVAAVLADAGHLDAVVANAAYRGFGRISTIDPQEWDAAIAVNLTSVAQLVRLTIATLRATGGQIVLVGSHAADRHFEAGGAYCASKAGLKALAEVLLLEERPHGVRTSLLSPGAIANEPGDESPAKISLATIAHVVQQLLELPADAVVGELEVRPSYLDPGPVTGLDRLQAV
jgi:NAD(P)-dependent dehydrogenase (short-subunit alcohol dehydrogenase family)